MTRCWVRLKLSGIDLRLVLSGESSLLENPSLKRKLKTLQTHVKRTEALAAFLTKNPELASDCTIKPTEWAGRVSLYFEGRAYIHAVGSDPVKLRLQRDYATAGHQEIRVCDDLSGF